jgi:hypothetical protein
MRQENPGILLLYYPSLAHDESTLKGKNRVAEKILGDESRIVAVTRTARPKKTPKNRCWADFSHPDMIGGK